MVSEFDTSVSSTSQTSGGGGISTKTIIIVVLLVAVAYGGYRIYQSQKARQMEEEDYDE